MFSAASERRTSRLRDSTARSMSIFGRDLSFLFLLLISEEFSRERESFSMFDEFSRSSTASFGLRIVIFPRFRPLRMYPRRDRFEAMESIVKRLRRSLGALSCSRLIPLSEMGCSQASLALSMLSWKPSTLS